MNKSVLSVLVFLCSFEALAASTSVKSTTPASSPSYVQDMLTIEKMCAVFKNVDMGRESRVECARTSDGLIEMKVQNKLGQLSILANASDMMHLEYYGDPVYTYTNNANQMVTINFQAVNTGVRKGREGAIVDGYYKADINMRNGNRYIRAGAFIQDFGTR